MKKGILLIVLVLIITAVLPAFAMYEEGLYQTTDTKIAVNGRLLSLERQPVAINQRTLAPARTIFSTLNAIVDWYPNTGKVIIERNGVTITMTIGDSNAWVNNVHKEMDTYPVLVRGTVMVPVRYVAEWFGFSVGWDGKEKTVYIGRNSEGVDPSRGNGIRENWGKYTVVVDPGHGGSNPGAVYKGVREKDFNLDIAKRLENLLKDQGINVYMTRTDDSFVSLYDRANLANKVSADLFISVHNNSGLTNYTGTMTLYYPSSVVHGKTMTSRDIANVIQKELSAKLGSVNLGIQSRPDLAVLKKTKMPAFIAEVGFITNEKELENLNNPDYRQSAADGLKDAILKVLKKLK
jgi:N-acetylmuramoyl-L-alanine amidase